MGWFKSKERKLFKYCERGDYEKANQILDRGANIHSIDKDGYTTLACFTHNVELNNGRAAMMGIIGNMVAEELTGQTMYEQYAAGHISPFGDGQGVF